MMACALSICITTRLAISSANRRHLQWWRRGVKSNPHEGLICLLGCGYGQRGSGRGNSLPAAFEVIAESFHPFIFFHCIRSLRHMRETLDRVRNQHLHHVVWGNASGPSRHTERSKGTIISAAYTCVHVYMWFWVGVNDSCHTHDPPHLQGVLRRLISRS